MKKQTRWQPPPGTQVVLHTDQPLTCCNCQRPLPQGTTALAYLRKNSPPRKYRCIDTDDCLDIVKLGRWPAAQPGLMALAGALESGYRIRRRR